MADRCAACGNPAKGKFCSQCGVSLRPVECAECGARVAKGARFCNLCGTPLTSGIREPAAATKQAGPGQGRRDPRLYAAVAAAVVLAAFMVVPRLRTAEAPRAGGAQLSAPVAGAGAVDLSATTPRGAADRLFNRVMESVSVQDSLQARAFAPMAITAYERLEVLDLDGRYHLALLHLVNDDPAAARREADSILAEVPTHLFGLFTAAQAEELMGNPAAAAPFYRRFLGAYETEVALSRPEYLDHARMLPTMREEAAASLGGV
jgi:hypothetical protein